MEGFYYTIFFVIILMYLFLFLTRKYNNPYKLIMIFGKKGCGKTTYLSKLAYKYRKKGWYVFSTEDIKDTIHISYSDIGHVWFPEHSVILIDEVGMIWDNRNFKNFDTSVRDWFKYQRHNRCIVYLFSQSFDVDKKLRDLTDSMYLLTNVARIFSYGKKINKSIVLNNSTAEAPSNIAENLVFEPFIFFFLGTRTLTFIPRWSKSFNSHTRLNIPDMDSGIYSGFLPEKSSRKKTCRFFGRFSRSSRRNNGTNRNCALYQIVYKYIVYLRVFVKLLFDRIFKHFFKKYHKKGKIK